MSSSLRKSHRTLAMAFAGVKALLCRKGVSYTERLPLEENFPNCERNDSKKYFYRSGNLLDIGVGDTRVIAVAQVKVEGEFVVSLGEILIFHYP